MNEIIYNQNGITLWWGNTLDILKKLPSESVDCIITSPPYWGLRIYKTEPQIWGGRKNCKHEWINENTKQDNLRYRKGKSTVVGNYKNPNIYTNPHLTYYICSKCGAYKGHLGLEPDFNLYIKHLLMITAELKRVLKKTGSFWLNLGDAYASSGTLESRFYHGNNQGKHKLSNDTYSGRARAKNYPQKCMLMLPERIAIAMIEQGWILREKIIWAKQILIQKERRTIGSALPTSCKDRFNMTWEYLYHFTKSKKYYSDLDSVRIPIQTFENRPDGFTRCREYGYNSKYLQEYSPQPKQSGHRFNYRVRDAEKKSEQCPQFRASEEEIKRYKGKFSNLSPEEAEMFNSPRARNLRPNKVLDPRGNHNGGPGSWRDFKDEHPSFTHPLGKNLPTVWLINPEPHNFSKEFGANCDHFAIFPEALLIIPIKFTCPEGETVLDPFCGSGTTGVVAQKLGRKFIRIDLNKDYLTQIAIPRIEKERTLFPVL